MPETVTLLAEMLPTVFAGAVDKGWNCSFKDIVGVRRVISGGLELHVLVDRVCSPDLNGGVTGHIHVVSIGGATAMVWREPSATRSGPEAGRYALKLRISPLMGERSILPPLYTHS